MCKQINVVDSTHEKRNKINLKKKPVLWEKEREREEEATEIRTSKSTQDKAF